jgi:hypothetical protein
MTRRILGCCMILLAAVLVAACASTSIKSAWFDPGYAGGAFHRILVVGIHGNLADVRVFEDIFTQKLNAAGVDGLPGYQFVAKDSAIDEAAWNAAVARSAADGLMTVRLLRVDTRTRVSTTMLPGPTIYGPYGGWWGSTMMPVQEVYQYDIASVETTLWDVKSRRVVWAGVTDTFNPTTVARETPGFADLIIGQLAQQGLLPAPK